MTNYESFPPRRQRLIPLKHIIPLQYRYDLFQREGLDGASMPLNGRSAEERVIDGFFRGLGYGLKERRHSVVVDEASSGVEIRGDGDDVVTRTVGHAGASTGQADEGTLGQALEIPGIQRSIGGDDHHDAAVGALTQGALKGILPKLASHRRPVDRQYSAEVGLDEYADGVSAE